MKKIKIVMYKELKVRQLILITLLAILNFNVVNAQEQGNVEKKEIDYSKGIFNEAPKTRASTKLESDRGVYINFALRIAEVFVGIAMALKLKGAVNKIQSGEKESFNEVIKWGALLVIVPVSMEVLLKILSAQM